MISCPEFAASNNIRFTESSQLSEYTFKYVQKLGSNQFPFGALAVVATGPQAL